MTLFVGGLGCCVSIGPKDPALEIAKSIDQDGALKLLQKQFDEWSSQCIFITRVVNTDTMMHIF